MVLSGLSAADEQVIPLLDGTLDLAGVAAAADGVPLARVERIVGALVRAGLVLRTPSDVSGVRPPRSSREEQRALVPDARVLSLVHAHGDGWGVLSRRWRATALVVGASRTGLSIALGLAGAGVGRVLVRDGSPVGPGDVFPGGYVVDDVGHPREARARALLAARAPIVLTAAPLRARPPDVAVVVGAGALVPARVEAAAGAALAHLPVLWREGGTVVGPLVRPGASACLRCLDLHRAARDPAWPRVAAQVATRPAGSRSRPEELSLAAQTAGIAVVQALAQLDGAPSPAALSATLECALPDGLVVRRGWDPHPACGCTWREGAAWSAEPEAG